MNILFIANGLNSGGSERVLSTLVNQLVTHSHYNINVICVNGRESFYPIDNRVNVVFLDKEKHTHNLFGKMLWIRSFAEKKGIDVVISFIVKVYGFAIFSLLGSGIPIITSERNDPRSFDCLSHWIMRIFLPFSNHHVVQTESIKNFYPQFIQIKTTVIANPVNPIMLSQPSVEKKDVIISVGRLVSQKNHRMMIESFAAIANRHPSYKLVIYGEGPLRDRLQEQITQLRMDERIKLPGRTKEIVKYLNEARIFCMSSTHEGMSNALIEALCIGLPIVTTNVSGVDELIINEENGLVVNANDTSSYTRALDRLINDEYLQQRFSMNNRKKASLFNLLTITKQWETIIQESMRNN